MSGFRIETAQLDWAQGQGPVSRRFGDVYFSAEDGLAETRHVFLGGCGLPEAWAGKGGFTIGETGFGSGLNFLAAWQSWRKTAPPGSRLHYVSVEGFPLSPADLKRVHEPWPELAELSQALLAVYPLPRPGFHRLLLDSGRVSLTLMLGEALNMLSSLEGRVDAWFLDGFAPSGNPDMWRPEVLDEIARLSAPDARLASFTVAGVRSALSWTRPPASGASGKCWWLVIKGLRGNVGLIPGTVRPHPHPAPSPWWGAGSPGARSLRRFIAGARW